MISFSKIKLIFFNICGVILSFLQSLFKGFANQDVYYFYKCFISRHLKLLKQFKKYHDSCPCDLTEEEWSDILDKLIYHLEMMDEEKVMEVLSTDMPEGYTPDLKSVSEVMKRHKKEFFELFSKYFYELWY